MNQGVCGDFLEGACDLSENNILDHNRYTNTPAECQVDKMLQKYDEDIDRNIDIAMY